MTLIPSHLHTTVIRRARSQMEAPEAVPHLVRKLGSRPVHRCMVEPLFSGSPARIRASLRDQTARDSIENQYWYGMYTLCTDVQLYIFSTDFQY